MSRTPDSSSRNRKDASPAEDTRPERRTRAADYQVGYGKPPVATRFVKGQSGNPHGRPRKQKARPPRLSDAPSDRYLEEEAYRSIALRENGLGIELPALQAVLRSVTAGAIKGNRLSQKYFLEHVARREELHLQRKVQHYLRLETLKREGERTLAEYRRRGVPPPELLPHPDDIVLNPATGDAFVNGPETTEDVRRCEHSVEVRDFLLLRAAHALKVGNGPTIRHGEESLCLFLLFAQILEGSLPRRYRWQGNTDVLLMMEYESLSRPARERHIAAECARLRETQPEPLPLPPEVRRHFDRLAAWFRARTTSAAADHGANQTSG